MAYSKDFRWCVVKKVKEGMTWNEVLTLFQISRQTLSKWLKMEENGNLSDPPRRAYKTRKIEVTKLKKWVESQPDFTLAEYAEHCHCRPQAVANRLKQLRITRKKKRHAIKNEMKNKDKNTLTNSNFSKESEWSM